MATKKQLEDQIAALDRQLDKVTMQLIESRTEAQQLTAALAERSQVPPLQVLDMAGSACVVVGPAGMVYVPRPASQVYEAMGSSR